MQKLIDKSYNFGKASDAAQTKLDDEAFTYFNRQVPRIEKQLLRLYMGGMKKGYYNPSLTSMVAISNLPEKMPRTDQLGEFSRTRMLKLPGFRNSLKHTNIEKAYYLYKHALEYNWSF